jgi:signal transduction histidine kinase
MSERIILDDSHDIADYGRTRSCDLRAHENFSCSGKMNSVGPWWLYSGQAVPAAIIFWIVLRERMGKRGARARTWSEARQMERERIARDLHDTLLQAFQAVLLRLDLWGKDTGLPEESREQMKEVARQTRDIVIEGRDKIFQLRNEGKKRQYVADLIRRDGDIETALWRVRFRFEVRGRERALPVDVANDVVGIVREAIRNAVTHSGCDALSVKMVFRHQSLTVCVEDDGCGIDSHMVAERQSYGHFGLVGMYERAAALDARLSIFRKSGRGTGVVLRIPIQTVVY